MKRRTTIKLLLFATLLFFATGQLGGCGCLPWTQVPSVVLMDNVHQNIGNYAPIPDYYATVISTLQGMGYTVKLASEVGLAPSISTYGIVILAAPLQAYTSNETQALVKFVKDGGKLIMMGEYGSYGANTNLNTLSSALGAGITFNMDAVYDDTNNYNGNSDWPVTSNFVSHATTSGLSSIAYFATCSLSVQNPATAIVYAEDTAYTYANLNISKGNSAGSGLKAPGTKVRTSNIVLSAVAKIGNGKVIAIGDTNIFGDDVDSEETDFINVLDNLKFFKNIVTW